MDKNNTPGQEPKINPNSPKMRLIRLIVGMVIITLGIVIFNVSSKWYQEAEEKDAVEKAEREQMIRQITSSADSADFVRK